MVGFRRTEREFTAPMADTFGVPTATADDETRRVNVELSLETDVIQFQHLKAVREITVRMDISLFEPEDSNGIPQALDAETSTGMSREETNALFMLNEAEKVALLMRIYEQAALDGHMNMLQTPIYINGVGIRWLVLDWAHFTSWIEAHFIDDYDALIDLTWPFRQRAAARLFLKMMRENLIPELQEEHWGDPSPYRLIRFKKEC